MTKSKLTILLDTNVWDDLFLGYRPRHKDAVNLISLAQDSGVLLVYAITSIKDVCYTVAARLKDISRKKNGGSLSESEALAARTAAFSCIENMKNIASAVGFDASDVWLAGKYRAIHSDFEDNLIVAAAERANADYIVTNDDVFLRHCPIAALSSADMCALLRSRLQG